MKTLTTLAFLACIAASALTQNPTPFSCTSNDGFGYYVSSSSFNLVNNNLTYSSSRLSSIETSTGARTTLCSESTVGVSLNALAFNPKDNYLYAVSRYDASQFSGKLYRMGANCQKQIIPVTGGIVSFTTNDRTVVDQGGGNISSGTFDLDNNYYVNTSYTVQATGFTNKLQKIKLTGSSASVTSTVTLTCPSCNNVPKLQITDIIYDEGSGRLYGSERQTGKLCSINAATGVVTPIGTTGITSSVLGMYKNKFGQVRAIDETGKIYSVNLTTGAFQYLNAQSSLNSQNADAASGCFAPFISGHIFVDANGLNDNIVNGIGTQKAGTTNLFAQLVQGNILVKTSSITSSGVYQFLGNFTGSYEVQISVNQGVIGQVPPAQGLPNTYAFVGDQIGIVIGGSDGTPNGKISLSISGSNIENVNFGIDARPIANNVMAPSQTNPGGNVKVTVPALEVTDVEDGIPNTIIVHQVPNKTTKGTLYYNNVAAVNNQIISNFQSSLLNFDPIDGNVNMTFDYHTEDAASVTSNTASASMTFTALLPITLSAFEGVLLDNHVNLSWTTSSEINSDYFKVQRSVGGDVFVDLSRITASGWSTDTRHYSYTDSDPKSLNYYRLMEVDFDGATSYSPVISISRNVEEIFLFPTIISDGFTILYPDQSFHKMQLAIYDLAGQLMHIEQWSDGRHYFDVQVLPLGAYHVQILDVLTGKRVIKQIVRI